MTDALTILLSGGAAGSIATWLTKQVILERLRNAIRAEYEQKLETHKAQLRAETEKEIERLKAQLQIAAAERHVRYSQIFDKRVEGIVKVHTKLLAFRDSVASFAAA